MPWQYLIVDEAHRLKNVESRLRVAVQGLDAQQMALLTGTPVQNSTAELFSLLNLLDPARFGDAEDFEERYGDMHSAEQVGRLTALLRPYLLRRTKGDVDLGLAPMRETLISVEITNFQKASYRALLEQNRELLLRGAEGATNPDPNPSLSLALSLSLTLTLTLALTLRDPIQARRARSAAPPSTT